VTVLIVSAPSTVTSLLRSRIPPKETRVTSNSVIVDCRLVRPVATPGVSNTKSVKSPDVLPRHAREGQTLTGPSPTAVPRQRDAKGAVEKKQRRRARMHGGAG
jgi:hypothetical protein